MENPKVNLRSGRLNLAFDFGKFVSIKVFKTRDQNNITYHCKVIVIYLSRVITERLLEVNTGGYIVVRKP